MWENKTRRTRVACGSPGHASVNDRLDMFADLEEKLRRHEGRDTPSMQRRRRHEFVEPKCSSHLVTNRYAEVSEGERRAPDGSLGSACTAQLNC